MKKVVRSVAFLSVLLTVAGLALAQGSDATVRRAEPGYLVDQDGLSLYIYLRDTEGHSTCYDVCVNNWPPLLTEGEPVAGEGVIASLLGTTQREDGTTQVTFGGWPLYYHARDDDPQEVHGHRMGDVFFLVTPAGARINVPIEPVTAEEQEVEPVEDEVIALGEAVYTTNCAACHGPEGQGGAGPALANSNRLSNANNVITTVLQGRPDHGMPPFGDVLEDEQVAAVVTYVRNSFGNEYGPVGPEQVEERR